MEKLILRKSCFNGIDGAVVTKITVSSEHKEYMKQVREEIEKYRIKSIKAYINAKDYYTQ